MILTNKKMYSTWEFQRWACETGISQPEAFLLTTYLDKSGKTLEAGIGGGRIIIGMRELGFTNLHGYDFLPEFIEAARRRIGKDAVTLAVQDATELEYCDRSFDQVIYLGNMISSLEDYSQRLQAMKEAFRILKPGGVALFSFLNFHSRSQTLGYRLYLQYLHILRLFTGNQRLIQEIPWLKPGGKPNLLALLDRGPYVYWYTAQEAYEQLQTAGFQVMALGSNYQTERGRMLASVAALMQEPISGGLYFVCTK